MFTGIVTDIGEVLRVEERAEGLRRLPSRAATITTSIAIGASIACSGVCMTVVATGEHGGRDTFAVDAAAETLRAHHGRPLARRHAHQPGALAEDRRRTRRPSGHRPCRRRSPKSSRARI